MQLDGIPRYALRESVYALEDPTCPIPGLYIRTDGAAPHLTRLPQACLAPATERGIAWLARRAQRLVGIPHELVRVDA